MQNLDKGTVAARILSTASKNKLGLTTLDMAVYLQLFSFVPQVHTVHDQTGKPVFAVVKFDELRRLAKIEYNFKDKESNGPLKDRIVRQ